MSDLKGIAFSRGSYTKTESQLLKQTEKEHSSMH